MKQGKMKKHILALVSLVIAFACIGFVLWMLGQNQSSARMRDFKEGWKVSLNGMEVADNADLPEVKFKHLNIGDKVVILNRLPENVKDGETLTFLVYLSTVEVKVDGKVIYTYGQEYAKKNRLVGSGYHFIDLPNDCAGKMIQVTMEVREPDAFTNMLTPTLSKTSGVYENFARRNMVGICICMFLTLLGALLMVISSVSVWYNKTFVRLIYIGVFSFLMGIWSMCNMKVLQVFEVDLAANSTVEYMTLYFAPIAFVLLIAEVRKDASRWKRQIVYGVAILLFLFAIITTILHFTNVEHYPRFLSYFHIFGGVSLVLVAATSIDKKKKFDVSSMVLYVGIIMLSVTIGLDLIRFNLQKYVFQDNEMLTFSIIQVGVLAFIICLLNSYILYVYSILMDRAEQEWLTERVYHDELCGVYNRTKCNEEFRKLNRSDKDYALVNLDLNGLKTINDSLGHTKGDELLQEFAKILQSAFDGVGDVFRMGGDEFLVIVREDKFSQMDQCLNRMVKLEQRRSGELSYTIDSSYGVAKRSECPGEMTEKVYSMADQRMYEMKTKKKINRRLRQ
ncbi:MAG: diguanylate cyclase [Lachnospiraceae bacterium]|nr:diguanylate cyclase [Lachnospiraceae bacterium]